MGRQHRRREAEKRLRQLPAVVLGAKNSVPWLGSDRLDASDRLILKGPGLGFDEGSYVPMNVEFLYPEILYTMIQGSIPHNSTST